MEERGEVDSSMTDEQGEWETIPQQLALPLWPLLNASPGSVWK